ncbi:MAG: GNAT family N-acetyltransferase [Christensenella sp.]|nr:GNAT family N-acetyltransferase [Christensenella sp.]
MQGIRKLKKTDTPEAKKVWENCFGDTDEFVAYYFKHIIDLEKSLGYFEQGSLISDLFMLPFAAKFGNADFACDFIAGCATMPQARKRGIMRELIRKALLDMLEQGKSVNYLHPFLHAFYRQFGYETIAYVKTEESCGCTTVAGCNKAVLFDGAAPSLPLKKMLRAYREYINNFDHAFLRSEERFCSWLELLFEDHGGAVVLQEEGIEDRIPYALYYTDEDRADVFELVFFSEDQKEALIQAIPAQRIRYFLPSEYGADGAQEFTMMRVLNPEPLLAAAPILVDEAFVIEISDPFLDRLWKFEVEPAKDLNKVRGTSKPATFSVQIQEFTEMLCGIGKNPIRIFRQQSTCFFETY